MGYSDASHWLACFSTLDLKRSAAKQILWRWCVQGARSAADLYTANDQELAELGLDAQQYSQLCACQELVAEQAALLAQLKVEGIELCTRAGTAYPETLIQRLPEERLPYLLYYRGNLDLLTLPGIALVGSNQPSEAARVFTQALIKQLAQQEFAFISGYSKGIDRIGIEAALAAGAGCVLVLPLGLRAGRKMLSALEPFFTTGKLLVLSPYSCDAVYSESLATARLPVIAGLSETVLAIEPSESPDTWLRALRAPLPRLGVWEGTITITHELWIAQGATRLTTVEDAQQEILEAIDGYCPEPAPSQLATDILVETSIAFVDADSAIETLSQSGAVPAVLARRLRERAPEWNR